MLADVILGLAFLAVLVFHLVQSERWAAERRHLVNVAIARHAPDVIALDREPPKRRERSDEPTPIAVGL